ncbi:carbohydrate porin [Comamonas sediminis]|uniref:Carbohydrate porin n=1 Tax=Comamonas sediminis TaxID=1783360 RepID=A0ABV4B0N9_9BURK
MRLKLDHLPVAGLLFAWSPAWAQELRLPQQEPPPTASSDPAGELVRKLNEATGLELWGYGRSGVYSSPSGQAKGGYTLGGDLQHYRLGNEGDNYLEFGIGKQFALGKGSKLGFFYMPSIYNGKSGTAQAYVALSGIAGSSATLWAGQRYHRIHDIHILDKWILEDGDNYGLGIDGLPMGVLGRLNAAIYTADSIDSKSRNDNNAGRLNLQWQDIPSNANGKLTLTAALVSGKFSRGRDGLALGLMHQQKDFLLPRLNHTLVLQASSGHAAINGKFYNLDVRSPEKASGLPWDGAVAAAPAPPTPAASQPGAKQYRLLDTIDFQWGKWGGQALLGYQSLQPDNGVQTRDLSVGGRLSYGVAPYTKLLAELGSTRRNMQHQDRQQLSKATLAVAFSPNTDFWTRPELRVYVSHARWNQAASRANVTSYGSHGRTSSTLFGIQAEAWW